MNESKLSHVDDSGHARMVDVSTKPESRRVAVAEGLVVLRPEVLARLLSGDLPKGPVIETARIAGIMAAKRTSDVIPLCHPIRLSEVDVRLAPFDSSTLRVEATAIAMDRTGVEMEAMTAVAVAALTVYDMVKAVDRAAVITGIRLIRKEGGKSGTYAADEVTP